jgi:uncharacterized protein YceH (UPF0502 family)
MKLQLTDLETRIIGCLLEKQITTPEQYPLSLNALMLACNQKTNREPIMNLSEPDVQRVVDVLQRKSLVIALSGSRVPKYQHRFGNTEFSDFQLNKQELGIICLLFLRGPQTPGELRTRSQRLCQFKDVDDVELALMALMDRKEGAFVTKLPLEPGRREHRYAHLFSGPIDVAALNSRYPSSTHSSADTHEPADTQLQARVDALERRVEELERLVGKLGLEIDGSKSN